MTGIDDQMIAAYAEGRLEEKERGIVRRYLVAHPDEIPQVMMLMADSLDDDHNIGTVGHIDADIYLENLGAMLDDIDSEESAIYESAMAAKDKIDNMCAVRCEGIALRHFGIAITDDELLEESVGKGWLKKNGTALQDIGRLSEARGLKVIQRRHCRRQDIAWYLEKGDIVIAVLDGNELLGDSLEERLKDLQIGNTPNHVIIINSLSNDSITITDSATPQQQDVYPLVQFLDAWDDSNNYLIIIGK